MSPKETKLRALAVPGSTADFKERVNMRSDSMTYPRERKTARKQIKKMMNSGLIPADDQPGPMKAHRKAVTDYENGEYLRQQEAWIKAGRPSWYGPAQNAMNKAEVRKSQFIALMLHLKYVTIGTVDMYVVKEADLPGVPTERRVKELEYELKAELNRRLGEHSRRMEEEVKRRGERVNIRSDAMTAPSKRQKTWNQIEKLLKQWQTRGLIPADDQPTKAHRKAVVEYENAEYLQQQEAWRYEKKLKKTTTVRRLLLHLKYVSQGSTNSMHVVQAAALTAKEDKTEK
ncbi:hypothetical protein F7725_028750 [Dissostichus mawsoni]|uniref:Uncharacterized protein n=1 Tax=Dissostichus mawsoni TaxID=36200 RepID=A0A7J5XGI4_DISMA|nr:hypothetical protein F7725_028750 [Dissostichus mawsoni]